MSFINEYWVHIYSYFMTTLRISPWSVGVWKPWGWNIIKDKEHTVQKSVELLVVIASGYAWKCMLVIKNLYLWCNF